MKIQSFYFCKLLHKYDFFFTLQAVFFLYLGKLEHCPALVPHPSLPLQTPHCSPFLSSKRYKTSNLGDWHTLQYDIKAYFFIFDIQTVYTSWESYAFGSSVLILIISSAYLVTSMTKLPSLTVLSYGPAKYPLSCTLS